MFPVETKPYTVVHTPARIAQDRFVCRSFYPFAEIVDQQSSVGSSVVEGGDTVVFLLACRIPYLKAESDVTQMHHSGQVGT